MTKYPNSGCDAHRNVKTSEPVCIICMAQEIERLENVADLAAASLDARSKEARAAMAYENARNNFLDHAAEAQTAMIAASEADRKLREALAPPNVGVTGLAPAQEGKS